MGLYDTINGEQVKVFPWYNFYPSSLSESPVTGHGGSLRYYSSKAEKEEDKKVLESFCKNKNSFSDSTPKNMDDDKVPYHSLAYNYGKDFIIIDFRPDLSDDQWVAHVIKDGRIKKTVYASKADKEFEDDLKNTGRVVDYWGDDGFNFKTLDDIKRYMDENDAMIKHIHKIQEKCDLIWKEYMGVTSGIERLDKNSDEFKERTEKAKEIYKRYIEEYDRIAPETTRIKQEFTDRWIIECDDVKMNIFGEWVESGILLLKNKKEQEKKAPEEIERAKKYGYFTDYEENFKKYCELFGQLYEKMLAEDSDWMQKYLEWCEATEEERGMVGEMMEYVRK